MNVAQPQRPLQPAVTLASVRDIWLHVWEAMLKARVGRPDLVACPRLSALDINVGSFRVSHQYGALEDWEHREQIRFRARRSVRDDDANAGLATVSCVMLEESVDKRGTGSITNEYQERLMEEVQERASNGSAWERDPRLDRQGSDRIEIILEKCWLSNTGGFSLTRSKNWNGHQKVLTTRLRRNRSKGAVQDSYRAGSEELISLSWGLRFTRISLSKASSTW